jgi:hypothetical protein
VNPPPGQELPVPRPDRQHEQVLTQGGERGAGHGRVHDATLTPGLLPGDAHWVVHRQIFRYGCRVNRKVSVLNMDWLLMMILTPLARELGPG